MPLSDAQLGAFAALGAAVCWVITSLAFAAAGRRVGPTAVNLIRIMLAVVVLAVVHRIAFGAWVPRLDRAGVWYLAISGVIGLAIGDQLLFTALVDVGSRMSTLLMTLAPPAAALLALPLLDERLGVAAVAGMAITLGGIGIVVLGRPEGAGVVRHRRRARGIVFGIVAALCQGAGLVLAKLGIGHTRLPAEEHLDPWSATLVRMVFAAAALVMVTALVRLVRAPERLDEVIEVSVETEHLPPMRSPRGSSRSVALTLIVVGAIFGPVLGVWCSLIAVDLAPAGISATLMAMTPVLILPLAVWIEKERLNWRAIVGALVAVAGVVLLSAVA